MRLGIVTPFDGRPGRTMQDLREMAGHAESAGIDSMWFPEHVVFFERYRSPYPYTDDGDPGFGPRTGVYDPLFACTVAASATNRLRVGTAILILPLRNPIVLAQEVVAVDHASAGRLDLGIGLGWSEEEYEALGVPWAGRGARTDEAVAAMTALWTQDLASHDGPLFPFHDVVAEPKPVQRPRPPVWVGGGVAAMRRAARVGDGWYGWAIDATELRPAMDELDRRCVDAGRDPATLGRKVGLPFVDDLARYLDAAHEAGIDEVVIGCAGSASRQRARIDELAAVSR